MGKTRHITIRERNYWLLIPAFSLMGLLVWVMATPISLEHKPILEIISLPAAIMLLLSLGVTGLLAIGLLVLAFDTTERELDVINSD